MPERHSNPCRPSATQRATTSSQGSPAATISRPSSRDDAARAHEDDRARDALVGDHDVRAAGEHEVGAGADRRDQLVLAVGLDQATRRPAQAEGRERREPHAPPSP